jgi:hypothetical protein
MGNVLVDARIAGERAAAAQSVADANAAMARLQADYAASPDQRGARAREHLSRLQSDPYHLNKQIGGSAGAANEEAVIAAQVRQFEAEAQAAAEAFSEQHRLANAFAGVVDQNGVETTVGQQIPARDLTNGVQDILSRGARTEVLEHYLKTGAGGGEPREHEIALAAEWHRRLMADGEMQKKFLAGDPAIMAQFQHYAVYAKKFDE